MNSKTSEIILSSIHQSLKILSEIDGYIGSCVIDCESGKTLSVDEKDPDLNLEIAAAGNSEVLRLKNQIIKSLNLEDYIEDVLITLNGQYHLMRPLSVYEGVFIYLVVSRERGNLAMARMLLSACEKTISLA